MMVNMFSFCFALFILANLGIHGQKNNLNTIPQNTVETTDFFGQLHHLIDQQKNRNQQAPISCYRIRANIKNAHPFDNTKYFICRNEENYEVFTCPNGGIFDDREKACIDLCEQRKPCFNQGQCIILANLTLQCVCRRDWTGEQCEIPLSTCANNPCGPNAECRMLHANDYTQDYVCICDKERSYGRSCQQTVPNPCLSNRQQQFHPFAYSRHAYINCDGERIFFQPCNAKLYWNQEEKRCDRLLPLLLRAPFLNLRHRHQSIQRQKDEQDFSMPIQNVNTQPWQTSQTIQNSRPFPNTFVETTTTASRVFHLQSFSSDNLGQQNIQWQNDQNQQTITSDTNSQISKPIQSNNQFGFGQTRKDFSVQQPEWENNQKFQDKNDQTRDMTTEWNSLNRPIQFQSGQWTPSPFETTTIVNNDMSQGLSGGLLRGWQSKQ